MQIKLFAKTFEKHTNDERFKITFNGVDIAEPYVFNITIENSDFKKDFIIDFQGCNRIVNAIVENASNQDVWEEIKSKARFEGTKLVITDFFLNPQEKYTLNIFTKEKHLIYIKEIMGEDKNISEEEI